MGFSFLQRIKATNSKLICHSNFASLCCAHWGKSKTVQSGEDVTKISKLIIHGQSGEVFDVAAIKKVSQSFCLCCVLKPVIHL